MKSQSLISFPARHLFVLFASLIMAALFLYAAWSKLHEYHKFIFQLGRSPYTMRWKGLIGWLIPSTELIIVLLLVRRQTRLYGLYASFALMFLFTVYIYAILHFSYYIPCSCGGILEKLSWQDHLRFNIFFTLLPAIAVLLLPQSDIQQALPVQAPAATRYFAKSGQAENLSTE